MALNLAGVPSLAWTHGDGNALVGDGGTDLVLTSAAGVDWTNDSLGGAQQHGATSLSFEPNGDFVLSARVTVDGARTTFDAGVLTVWIDDDHWAKLCFEFSPQGEAMIVSVVTNTYSDDCNSSVATTASPYLRLARLGGAFALHHSDDGRVWTFVRLFRLHSQLPALVGFMAQAPMGDHCTVRFDEISYAERTLADLRDGS